MAYYNFKKFFTQYQVKNNIFASNGHFVIKRNCLRKPQNDYVATFEESDYTEKVIEIFNQAESLSYRQDAVEFIPKYIGEEIDSKILKPYNVVFNEDHRAIKEPYYNFIKDLKCRVFYYPNENVFTPMAIYKDTELVGVVLQVRLKEALNNKVEYQELVKV